MYDLQYGPQAAFISESFPGSSRYSGASLGYQTASITAGGPAPLIALWLYEVTGTSMAVAGYVAVCAFISLVCVYLRTRLASSTISRRGLCEPAGRSGSRHPRSGSGCRPVTG